DRRLKPALILSCDNSLEGITNMEEYGLTELPDHIKIGLNSERTIVKELDEVFWDIAGQLRKGEFPYKTIIIDPYSVVYQRTLIDTYKERTGKKEVTRFDLCDYGNTNIKLYDTFGRYASLGVNLIVTCHTQTSNDEKT